MGSKENHTFAIRCMTNRYMVNERKICPICGSGDVGLYNSRKMTYHCHWCDSYWDQYGTVIENNYQRNRNNNQYRHQINGGVSWNGYTDPDDFPTEGLGDNGY